MSGQAPPAIPHKQADPTALVSAHRPCTKLFSVAMGMRAARAIYRGTRQVTHRQLRLLGWIEACQRNPGAQTFMRRFDRRLDRAHKQAVCRSRLISSLHWALASWYQDGGQTASGYHATYGVANLSLPFGTHVILYYRGRMIGAIVDDRGPYVAGREWDLSQSTAAALGFSGVDTIGYRIGTLEGRGRG